MSDPVTYTAVLPASDETVLFVSGLLAAERRRLGTRRGRRALGCNGNGAVTGSAAGSTDYDQFTVAYLQDVSGDLTGDGQPETVVMLGCTPQPSNFSVFEVQVFTASHTLLAELPSPATLKPPTPAAPEYDAHTPMTIQGGILSCRMLFHTATDTHASGPSQPQTVQWRWNGQQFSRVG